MPPSEAPEKRGNRPAYPHGASFAKLLDWHLDFGTRPTGTPDQPGERWSNPEFAEVLGVNERSVRNWRNDREQPIYIGSIERTLFGKNTVYRDWRFDLRNAYDYPVGDG